MVVGKRLATRSEAALTRRSLYSIEATSFGWSELEREYPRLELIQNQIRDIEHQRDAADAQEPAVERKRQMLIALQGIGGAGAAILAHEVFARTFGNRRQLGCYLGLTPSAYDSGSTNAVRESPRAATAGRDAC